MTLLVVDCSKYQAERPDPLDLATAQAAGFTVVNIALDQGRAEDVLPPWARTYADTARSIGMGISTYRWLDSRMSGRDSARRAYDRILSLGGPVGMAHVVDCEDNASEQTLRDYLTTMTGLLGRPVAVYSGRWWLKPRGWQVADLSPYLWAAPSAGYLPSYPGDGSPHWTVDYGGHQTLAVMQYAVAPLPGTGACSLSAIRDLRVWEVLTGEAVPVAWFLNRALSNFRTAVNAKYPRRDKGTDGTIGDAAHAGTSSDHNPDPDGSVDAWDMDVDLNGIGQPYAADVERLKAVFQAHESSQYWIHNDQICSRNDGWKRRSYAYAGPGRNKHDKHVHWNTRSSHENSAAPWVLPGGDDMAFPDDPTAMALAFRMDALMAGADNVRGGPYVGEQMWTVRAIKELQAAAAADATRDAVTLAAIQALAAGGTSVDTAAVIARINAVAADESATVAALHAEVASLRAALAEAARAAADAYDA